MYFLRFLVAGLVCAATSVAAEPVKLDSVFNIDEVIFVKQPGNSVVTGTASIKLADGTVKNCAGFNVELLPVAAYAKERIVRTYGNDQQGQILLEQNPPKFTPDVPEYHDTLIKGACDERGAFRFSNVPAGDYFVMVFIIWEDTSGATPRKTGGAAMKRIHVSAHSQVEAHIDGGRSAE
ncbi:MAG: hypothetical protein K0Q92_3623 [Steroidobacteraceae bacterium]|nr:hypothetical protein [Steroidobacteraceae bacterium]